MITNFIKIRIIDYKLNKGEDLILYLILYILYVLASAKNIIGAQ